MWLYVPQKDPTEILLVARVLPCRYSKEQYKGSGTQGDRDDIKMGPSHHCVGCHCFRQLTLTNPQVSNSNHHAIISIFIFHHSLLHLALLNKSFYSSQHHLALPMLDDTTEKVIKEILEFYKHCDQFQKGCQLEEPERKSAFCLQNMLKWLNILTPVTKLGNFSTLLPPHRIEGQGDEVFMLLQIL